MVASLLEIEDRRERTRQAKAVIAVMGNLNPLLRDTADFTHKLWDHLFIMSDFQLDVDSPYPRPSRQDLTVAPRRMPYSQRRILFKHYGKYVGEMIRSLVGKKQSRREPDGRQSGALHACQELRVQSGTPQQRGDHKDIRQMSGGNISIDEAAINNLRSDYKQHFTAHPQKAPSAPADVPCRKAVTIRVPVRAIISRITRGSIRDTLKTAVRTIRPNNFAL